MPAKSKAQQRFMGMVHAYQKGERKDAPKSVKKAAKSMTKKAAKDFAETKHKGLPEKVKEAHGFGLDMTLDQLEQELEQLQQEHEEMLLSGDVESLDEIEAEITEIEELIHQKKLMQKDIDVAEDLKSLTFKEYLRIDEGVLDFARGVGAMVGDVHKRGQAVTAQKQQAAVQQQLQKMVLQLARALLASGAVKQQSAEPQQAKPTQQGPTTPAAFRTKTGKPVAMRTKSGQTLSYDTSSQQLFGIMLNESFGAFMGGMAKAAGRKLGGAIAARNPHLAKGAQLGGALDDIVQAGRAASKRAAGSKVQNQKPQNSQNQIAVMAQNIVAFAKKQPNGLQTVTAILRQLAQQNKQLAIAIHQSLKDTMAAKAGV